MLASGLFKSSTQCASRANRYERFSDGQLNAPGMFDVRQGCPIGVGLQRIGVGHSSDRVQPSCRRKGITRLG